MFVINRLRRGFDPGFLAVLLICVLAVWPFVSRASLPEGTDAELHIFRLHELSYLVRGGEFYPRWAPDFYHGFGYPIFNYYAPLTYYLALPLELLPRVDAVLATKTILVIGMIMAGLGIYGFTRDTWGRRAGFVAGALYVYSPYLQYIDPHVRGVVPEMFSFGVFPLALWALDRLFRRPSAGSWLASGVLVAAVILSHNLMGLFFFALLAAWSGWQAILVWRARRRSSADKAVADLPAWASVGRLAAALLLGLGLSAFFWLPVFLERNAVTLSTLIGSGDNYDFRTHFLALGELLAFSVSPDWGATQSPFVFNLGVAQWVGGVLGVTMLILGKARERAQLAFFAIAALAVLFLMTAYSEPVWEALPFLPFFQFPWRLLGAVAAMLAVLGAAGMEPFMRESGAEDGDGSRRRILRGTRAAWICAGAVALPMMLALPLSQPTPWAPFGEVNTLRMSLIENSGRWLGTTSTADYVPATVVMLPQRRDSVVGPLFDGLPPDRVNWDSMPDGTEVTTEAIRPLLTRYVVNAPKEFRLRLYQFDFPGWKVTIDGQPAETELAEPEGLIVVIVPEGEHVVEVRFGTTPPRTTGWLIALLSAVTLGVFALRSRRIKPDEASVPAFPASLRSDWPALVTVSGLTTLALLAGPLGLFHNQSQGLNLDVPAVESYYNFGDQIGLLGHSAAPGQVMPGDVLDLTLYWKAQRQLPIDYQSFVHVLNEAGELVAQADKLNPGEFPTRRWPLEKYVPDRYSVQLPSDLPPGEYLVTAGMWVQSDGWRLPVFDDAGRPVADRANLFTFRID